jgi:hypothetical protein
MLPFVINLDNIFNVYVSRNCHFLFTAQMTRYFLLGGGERRVYGDKKGDNGS